MTEVISCICQWTQRFVNECNILSTIPMCCQRIANDGNVWNLDSYVRWMFAQISTCWTSAESIGKRISSMLGVLCISSIYRIMSGHFPTFSCNIILTWMLSTRWSYVRVCVCFVLETNTWQLKYVLTWLIHVTLILEEVVLVQHWLLKKFLFIECSIFRLLNFKTNMHVLALHIN